MRVGTNPAKKDASVVKPYPKHRVIIPVYIPNEEGYFQHSLEVLQLCLESLSLTTQGDTAVTVISNGCDGRIAEELVELHRKGWIDQLILDRCNRGKVNALLSVARGSHEPLLTMSDADILFLPEWLEKVIHLFRVFPECGSVSPITAVRPNCRHTSTTFINSWLRRELHFEKVAPFEELERHVRSLEVKNEELTLQLHQQGEFIVRRNSTVAVVGAGHAALTIRRELLSCMPAAPVMKFKNAGENVTDTPPDMAGYWRLSLPAAQAIHIGNVPDEWIYQKMEEVRRARDGSTPVPAPDTDFPALQRHWGGRLPWRWRRTLAHRLRSRLAPPAVRPLFEQLS